MEDIVDVCLKTFTQDLTNVIVQNLSRFTGRLRVIHWLMKFSAVGSIYSASFMQSPVTIIRKSFVYWNISTLLEHFLWSDKKLRSKIDMKLFRSFWAFPFFRIGTSFTSRQPLGRVCWARSNLPPRRVRHAPQDLAIVRKCKWCLSRTSWSQGKKFGTIVVMALPSSCSDLSRLMWP